MTTQRRVVVEVARKRQPPRVLAIRVIVMTDDDPETSYLDQDEFADRRKEYQRGDFAFVEVRAEAEVVINPDANGAGVAQWLTSGGIRGVESDSDRPYVEELANQEYSELRDILISIGVPTSALPAAFDLKQIEWRA